MYETHRKDTPSAISRNVMKQQEYILYEFIQQLGTITSPPCQRSSILKSIPRTQNTLLYQQRCIQIRA